MTSSIQRAEELVRGALPELQGFDDGYGFGAFEKQPLLHHYLRVLGDIQFPIEATLHETRMVVFIGSKNIVFNLLTGTLADEKSAEVFIELIGK